MMVVKTTAMYLLLQCRVRSLPFGATFTSVALPRKEIIDSTNVRLERYTPEVWISPSKSTIAYVHNHPKSVVRRQLANRNRRIHYVWRIQTSLYSTSKNLGENENPLISIGNKESEFTTKKRIVFLGTPEVAATTLRSIHERSQSPDSPYEVVGVVTQPPKRRKRYGKTEATPVGIVAEKLQIPYIVFPESAKSIDFLEELEYTIRPDLCITAAYGQYLPKKFLSLPRLGTVNIHPSLLPKWRGASPVQRSLEAGDNPVGVSVLYTVSKMDAGPIIAQKELLIDENDTATTILPRLFEIGTTLLLDVLPNILDGKISFDTATVQNEAAATKASMIDASEAELKVWKESAVTCHNRLRGFSMWPQTYMWFQICSDDGTVSEPMKVKITKTRIVQTGSAGENVHNDIVSLGPTKNNGLYVTCYDGSVLELLVVQPATRKQFPARDFQNGYPGKVIKWIQTPPPNDIEQSISTDES